MRGGGIVEGMEEGEGIVEATEVEVEVTAEVRFDQFACVDARVNRLFADLMDFALQAIGVEDTVGGGEIAEGAGTTGGGGAGMTTVVEVGTITAVVEAPIGATLAGMTGLVRTRPAQSGATACQRERGVAGVWHGHYRYARRRVCWI